MLVRGFGDPRIRVLQRDVAGPGGYAARNLAGENANGTWLVFLDADDEWYRDHLLNIRKVANQCPCASIIGSGWESIRQSRVTVNQYYAKHTELESHSISLSLYLKEAISDRRPFHTSAVAMQRTLFKSIGGFPEGRAKKGGDLYLWTRSVAFGNAYWNPFVGARYYHTSDNKAIHAATFSVDLIRSMVVELENVVSGEELKLLKLYANKMMKKAFVEKIYRHEQFENNFLKSGFYTGAVDYCSRAIFSLLPHSCFRLKAFLTILLRKAVRPIKK